MRLLFVCTAVMFGYCKIKGNMGKVIGAISVIIYVAYTAYIIIR
jgi:hypothetical protein